MLTEEDLSTELSPFEWIPVKRIGDSHIISYGFLDEEEMLSSAEKLLIELEGDVGEVHKSHLSWAWAYADPLRESGISWSDRYQDRYDRDAVPITVLSF